MWRGAGGIAPPGRTWKLCWSGARRLALAGTAYMHAQFPAGPDGVVGVIPGEQKHSARCVRRGGMGALGCWARTGLPVSKPALLSSVWCGPHLWPPAPLQTVCRLLSLCQQCHENDEVLACSLPSADMVLVPRLPTTAAQDGLYFLAYATNLRAVELCERLRQQKQVALVLDLGAVLAARRSASWLPLLSLLLPAPRYCCHGRVLLEQTAASSACVVLLF